MEHFPYAKQCCKPWEHNSEQAVKFPPALRGAYILVEKTYDKQTNISNICVY